MSKTNFGDLDVAAGSITAVEIGSGNAGDGQVLTAAALVRWYVAPCRRGTI